MNYFHCYKITQQTVMYIVTIVTTTVFYFSAFRSWINTLATKIRFNFVTFLLKKKKFKYKVESYKNIGTFHLVIAYGKNSQNLINSLFP